VADSGPSGEEIARLKYAEGLTWAEIEERFPEVRRGALRYRCAQYRRAGTKTESGQVEFDEQRNTAVATSSSARITTLEQLLVFCRVDLDVWRVERHVVNKWEVGAKAPNGQVVVTPLFQVKAWLVRREPIPVFPVLRPVACAATFEPPGEAGREGLARSLIFADPHFWFKRDLQSGELTPLHNRAVLDVILQIAAAARPDRIDILGDMLDMTDWTDRFVRSPEFQLCTQPALLEAHWWLAQFRQACPAAEIRLYEGNHGKRMRDAITKHLTAAYELRAVDELELPPAMSLPRLLALHQLGAEWVGDYPDEAGWLNDAVRLSHGDRAQVPGNTTKAVVQVADVTEIIGHIHRIEWTSRTKFVREGQEEIAAFCPGCACWTDGRVPGKRGRQQWQNGCAVIDYDRYGTMYAITPVVIADARRAIWSGQLFEARERLGDLHRDVPDWNFR